MASYSVVDLVRRAQEGGSARTVDWTLVFGALSSRAEIAQSQGAVGTQ